MKPQIFAGNRRKPQIFAEAGFSHLARSYIRQEQNLVDVSDTLYFLWFTWRGEEGGRLRKCPSRWRGGWGSVFFTAACLQNEIAREKLLNRLEKRFEKREKRSEKRSETCLKNVWPLSEYFTGTFQQILKVFHRPKFAQKKKLFFHREALQG